MSSVKRLYDCVVAYPNAAWDRQNLSENAGITIGVVNALDVNHIDWDWDNLSRNMLISDIKANPDLPWNWEIISSRWDIVLALITENPSKPWDWGTLSAIGCVELTGAEVAANPTLDWDYDALTVRLPVDQLLANPTVPWNWFWVRYNPSLTFKQIIDHPEISWDFSVVSLIPPIWEEDTFMSARPEPETQLNKFRNAAYAHKHS